MNILGLLTGRVLKQVGDIVDEFVTTDEEKLEAQLKIKQLELEETKIYANLLSKVHETNIAEAQAKDRFISGWRPFIGWVCGISIAYTFVLQPIIEWVVKILNFNVNPPTIDTTMLFNLVLGMLGLGGMRTYEKMKGVHNKHG